eukprot:3352006-Pyramimonas_sp.AAC.1
MVENYGPRDLLVSKIRRVSNFDKADGSVNVGELRHFTGHKSPILANPVRKAGENPAVENNN